MISGTIKAEKILKNVKYSVFAFLLLSICTLHAQDKETLAKSYFLQAEEAYNQKKYTNAEKYLDNVLEYLGSTNPRVEALYIKTFIANKKYIKAEQHLNTYFEKADEQHSAYNEMLKKLASVKEKAKEERRENVADLSFKDGYAEGWINGKVGLYNRDGIAVIPTEFDCISADVENGVVWVSEGGRKDSFGYYIEGKWGLRNFDNEVIVPIKYDYYGVPEFSEGLAYLKENDKYGFINTSGDIEIPFIYDSAGPFKSNRAVVKSNGKWGVIDKTEKVIVPFEFDEVESSKEGWFWVNKGCEGADCRDGGKWGLYDNNGVELFPCKFGAKGYEFSNNVIAVRMNNKWGFVNNEGETVIPFKYDRARSFDADLKGAAEVSLNGKKGFVDVNGEVFIPIVYDHINSRKFGSEEVLQVKKNGKYGFIDSNGNVIIPIIYDYVTYSQESIDYNFLPVKINKRWGVINTRGEIIVPIEYRYIGNYDEDDGYAVVKTDKNTGFYVDKYGNKK